MGKHLFSGNTMIKNLIFDFGGVVLPLSPEVAMERFGSLGIRDARQRLGAFGQKGIFRQVEDGSLDAEGFQRALGRLAQEQGRDFGDAEPSFTFEQCRWAWTGYAKRVDPVRLQNLLRLKEHYTVILLSNTNPFMMDWADSSEFSGDGHPVSYYFHRCYYSYLMHDYKPSPTIFQTVLRESGIRADESLFLDDGKANIEGAQVVGLHTLLVEDNEDWMPKLNLKIKTLSNPSCKGGGVGR